MSVQAQESWQREETQSLPWELGEKVMQRGRAKLHPTSPEQGWGSHRQPVPGGLTLLTEKNFSLISRLTLPSVSLKTFPFILSLHALVQSPSPGLLESLYALEGPVKSLWSLFGSRSNNSSSVSMGPEQKCSSSQSIFVAFPGVAPTNLCPFYLLHF